MSDPTPQTPPRPTIRSAIARHADADRGFAEDVLVVAALVLCVVLIVVCCTVYYSIKVTR